jgi:tetratricopeptide (TPR) repeat protein
VEYAQVADGDPANLESLKALGDLFNVLNKPDKSKKYYSKAVKAMGGQVKDDVLVQLANAQNKSGEVNAAIENLNKALEINPTNPTALQLLEGIWKTEIKYNPASVLAHANLAGVYQKLRRFEDALSQYNAAEHFANLDPQTSFDVKKLIRLNMGTLFQELKRYEQALQAYDTVLQAEPKHLLATYYKATLYKEAGQPEEAQRWYYRVLSIDPNNENVHRDLLEMVTKQSDPQKVIAGLKGYGDQVPQNALVQYKVGEELHKLKDFDDAALYYQKAIDLKPDMAAAYANLGAVLQTQGKDEESLAAFKKAVELDPNNETVKKIAKETQEVAGYKDFQKAIELQQAGNIAEALPYFKKALAASPNNPDYIADYGIALQNTSDLAGAIAQYQKALTLQPGNANYHYYLGTAYHQNH